MKKKKTVKQSKAPTAASPASQSQKPYVIACITAIIIFAGLAYIAYKGKVLGMEQTVFRWVNNWPDGLRIAMIVVTSFGGTIMAALSVAAAFLLRFYHLAWRLAFTIIGAYGVAFLAKHYIGRERPIDLFDNVHARIVETGMGFPSGHATLITVIGLTLLPYVPKRHWWILFLAIILVCISRLYLGVHVLLDVLGGIAAGTAAVSFVRILPKRLKEFLRLN